MADLLDVDATRRDVGGDHHFVAYVAKTVERLVLPPITRATEKNRRAQIGEAAVIVNGGLDLRCKLTFRL